MSKGKRRKLIDRLVRTREAIAAATNVSDDRAQAAMGAINAVIGELRQDKDC